MEEKRCWFVMRDLKPVNAKEPAYRLLSEQGFEVFTPMRWHISIVKGKKVRRQVPIIHNLLFVCSTEEFLNPVVARYSTLQYQYMRGAGRENKMRVGDEEMRRFIHAATITDEPIYYTPQEITPEMMGRRIKMVGGKLDGYEGYLISRRGSKSRRLLMALCDDSNLASLSMSVDVEPEYIQFV